MFTSVSHTYTHDNLSLSVMVQLTLVIDDDDDDDMWVSGGPDSTLKVNLTCRVQELGSAGRRLQYD